MPAPASAHLAALLFQLLDFRVGGAVLRKLLAELLELLTDLQVWDGKIRRGAVRAADVNMAERSRLKTAMRLTLGLNKGKSVGWHWSLDKLLFCKHH